MTLIQKQIYLKKLFGYDTLKNVEQKQLIERQVGTNVVGYGVRKSNRLRLPLVRLSFLSSSE
ncbi:unnamed protein product [Meloidogyne enterolobii]|uniref:Uncharacterized protein n=1 Tax=Meloidogyne enterolobii TaxID=390850 RepID=A0ACB0XRJ7_MELEN